jgi:predicted Zn-dependent protease
LSCPLAQALVTIGAETSLARFTSKEAAVTSFRFCITLAFGSLLAFVVGVGGADKKPTAKQIAQWIEQLGSDRFAQREEASKKLWAAGEAAEAALEKATRSDDVEVVRRAREILTKFKWGIYPDTPADVVALIRTYQSTEGNTRAETLQKLLQTGPAGLQAVLKIAKAETDPNQRKILGNLVANKLPEAFAKVLTDGRYESFEVLLELGHDSGSIRDAHYAAYWLLRGKLDDRIAQYRALSTKTPTEKCFSETLAYLYHAKGDLTEARKAAEKSERADLLEGILYEAADWKRLAARQDVFDTNTIEKWAYRAAFARLAGDKKESETGLNELLKLAEKGPENAFERYSAAKALLLNDRPSDGLALLAKMPTYRPMLFEIYSARMEYKKAFELVEQAQPAESVERKKLEVLQARTLFMLGEKDKAQKIFARLAEGIKENTDLSWAGNLLEAEYRVGLKDLAFEHFIKVITDGLPKGVQIQNPGPPLDKIFPQQKETARAWWKLLRQKFRDENSAAILKRLRNLMEGKVAAKEVKTWIEESDESLSKPPNPVSPPEAAQIRQALAEVALTAGFGDLATSLFEKAGTSEALIRLGDLDAAKKQWTKAAERYQQAWKKNLDFERPNKNRPAFDPLAERVNPLALYLAGDTLVKAGQAKEGKKLIEQSHWVLLGDSSGRHTFLRALVERGHSTAAQREAELLLRVSEPNSFDSGVAARHLAIAAAKRKEYRKAADAHEQSMLRCLRASTNFVNPAAFAIVPAQIYRLRASGWLAAGKLDEASQQIDLCLKVSPGNVDLSIALVPELERLGHKKEATALFERTLAVYEKVCRDYPRCSWAHNSAAWLSACCRRNLDSALAHAQKANELSPNNAGYLDTLAEVHFQRGDKDQAIATQKRVVKLDPKRAYFQKQLRRLEAGDPSAERPKDDEE